MFTCFNETVTKPYIKGTGYKHWIQKLQAWQALAHQDLRNRKRQLFRCATGRPSVMHVRAIQHLHTTPHLTHQVHALEGLGLEP